MKPPTTFFDRDMKFPPGRDGLSGKPHSRPGKPCK
jgi:hypothetical protein